MLVPLGTVTALMVAMAAKHFFADFLCQTATIARGKASSRAWLQPLLIHAAGHAVITFVIALVFFPRLWWVALLELVVHALIDRYKVVFGNRLHLDIGQPAFWWLFGFDQLLHHLTNIVIVFAFLAYGR